MRFFFIILLMLINVLSYAQVKYDYNWIFGHGGEFNDKCFGTTQIDFNSDPIKIAKEEGDLWLFVTNSTMSDAKGNLLYYTNGCAINDASYQTMANGDSLNLGEVHDIQCEYGYTAGMQSCLSLPAPENDHIYYLFHQHAIYQYTPNFDVIIDKLFYTKIDANLNNGLGGVVEKNVPVIEDSINYGGLAAVKHANGKDWWIINPGEEDDTYHTLLLTSEGIFQQHHQQIGESTSRPASGSGQILFSPNGKKYIRYYPRDGLFIFDFDRNTGLLANPEHYMLPDSNGIVSGTAISPNNELLYINHANILYQFDLEAEDLLASQIVIDTFDGFQDPFFVNFSQAQLGPDCRIYINSTSGAKYLHVINYPNRKGKACDFRQHYVELPTFHQPSMPNFPNYRLGTGHAVCDSTIALPTFTTSIADIAPLFAPQLKLYPNPARLKTTLEVMGDFIGERATVYLYNVLGERVSSYVISPHQTLLEIDTEQLPVGSYWCQLTVSGKVIGSEKLIVLK